MKSANVGIFHPKNPQKYKGTTPIIYRSLLERDFARFCDQNPKILEWGSESVIINYIKPTDNKVHRYFVDFNLVMIGISGKKEKYLVEIKPYKFTQPPVENTRRKQSALLLEKINFTINMAKFKAAREYCAQRNMKFIVLTEKELKACQ